LGGWANPTGMERSSQRSAKPQRTPLKGQRFERLAEAQACLDRWDKQWADKGIRGRTKRQVATTRSCE
jgi:hypothetical protein